MANAAVVGRVASPIPRVGSESMSGDARPLNRTDERDEEPEDEDSIAARIGQTTDWPAFFERKRQQLRDDAQALRRASRGWSQLSTWEEWQALIEEAEQRYTRGRFLIERLGAESVVEPERMAVLLMLR